MLGDPAGERERERRQQRTVGSDARGDRLERDARPARSRRRGRPPSAWRRPNSTRTASPLDEVRETVGHCVRVGSRAAAAGGVDRDLDASPLPVRGRDQRPAQQSFLLDHHGLIVAGPSAARFRPGRGGPDGGVLLRDDLVDALRGALDLAGLVRHDVVVVALSRASSMAAFR